jgi:hypothetical protein
MKSALSVLTCFILISTTSFAQTPDWSTKIASIIYGNCSACHHEGGIAPFPLMNYEDALSRAFSIQTNVNAGKMPPWPAGKDCSAEMLADRSMSADDIQAINDWVNGGMPEGDPNLAPIPPTFTNGSQLVSIDQTVQFPSYTVQNPEDEYRTFVVHSGYSSVQYLNQLEFIIGNKAIVHHILLYYDPTTTSWALDESDPGPGYASSGTTASSPFAVLIGGWVPGNVPDILPANMGYLIPPNSDFVMEIHYAPNSNGLTDSTMLNLKFCTDPSPRNVSVSPVLFHYWPSLENGPLTIPANTVKTFYEKSVGFTIDLDKDYSLYSVLPHMHLIGKSMEVYMTSPDNSDTTRLVCISDWDFRWQLGYVFRHLMHFPASEGYTLRAIATYDNTSNNPNNPFDPPQLITLGESTLNEMMVVFFAYLEYQEGDEDIDLGTVGIGEAAADPLAVELFPNPAADQLHISCWLESHDLTLRLLNASGAEVRSIEEGHQMKGMYATSVSLKDLPAGLYFIKVQSGGSVSVKKFVKAD